MQKARTCGGIPLVASHWFRPISRIPLIAFHRLRSSGSLQRLTPKAHPERRISSFQGLHFMKRTSSRIVTSCPSMESLKPGHRHPRNPPFTPHSSKHMLIEGGPITFAFFPCRKHCNFFAGARNNPVLQDELVRPPSHPIHALCGLFLLAIGMQSASSAPYFSSVLSA